jgi:hypothetical protein
MTIEELVERLARRYFDDAPKRVEALIAVFPNLSRLIASGRLAMVAMNSAKL